jgi:hypothetical protein
LFFDSLFKLFLRVKARSTGDLEMDFSNGAIFGSRPILSVRKIKYREEF